MLARDRDQMVARLPGELRHDRGAASRSAVQRLAGQTIAIGAVEKAAFERGDPAAAVDPGPGAGRSDPVAGRIARIGTAEGDGVEAVELALAFDPMADGAQLHARRRAKDGLEARGSVLESVAVALAAEGVDAVAPHPADRRDELDVARARQNLRRKAGTVERAIFGHAFEPDSAGRRGWAVDRDDAADRLGAPQCRLRSAHDVDPTDAVRRKQL